MMKVLVADKIAAKGVEFLRAQDDLEVIEAYGSTPEELKALAVDVQAIIVRSASSVTAEILEAAPQLKAVGRAGVGVDNIDVPAATDRGVVVLNTPGGNTIATAELAFTHLMASARPIAQANASMKAGRWEKKQFAGSELYGKTLGILGLGRIGSQVAKRALAFEMTVLAYDPYLTRERAEALGVEPVTLEALLPRVDFITIHMPKTDATRNMLDAKAFAQMKDGVRIVNCARGGLIHEGDLAEALSSGKVGAAGLDVFEEEPLAADSPLRAFDQLVLTPHLGASTVEAQENVGLEVAQSIVEVLRGGWVNNALNAPAVDPATLKLLRPYLALAYRLGTLLQQTTPNALEGIRITYSGKLVDLEVRPLTRAFQRGYLRKITTDVNDVNAPRIMKRLGIEGESVKTTLEREYTELIRVEATGGGEGGPYVVEGTLMGRSQTPRLTLINGREVEAPLDEAYLLVFENEDVPGIVGTVGTVMAAHGVNISNMSLSRNAVGGLALNLCGLDSQPPAAALDELRSNPAIRQLYLVDLNCS